MGEGHFPADTLPATRWFTAGKEVGSCLLGEEPQYECNFPHADS